MRNAISRYVADFIKNGENASFGFNGEQLGKLHM